MPEKQIAKNRISDLHRFVSMFFKRTFCCLGEFIYPAKCLKCGKYFDAVPEKHIQGIEDCFCQDCMRGEDAGKDSHDISKGLYRIKEPFCPKCCVLFPESHGDNHVCENCLKKPFKLNKIRAVAQYKGIVKDAVPLFKYQHKLSLSQKFESLMFKAFVDYFNSDSIDLIIPIPLHRVKLRQRGFNQAFFLVRNFKKLYYQTFERPPSWQIDIHSLVKLKQTATQTGFDIKQRKSNVKNAFYVRKKKNILGKTILLIDDVFTTGATCNEAATVLLKNGAKSVDALVFARV